jgi:hypothetical protein
MSSVSVQLNKNIVEDYNAPSIVSALQFLLRHRGDNEGLQGQALVPSEPAIDQQKL